MPQYAPVYASVDLISATTKARRRLIPFLSLLYIVAYLDRINVGFAALQMNEALGFSARTYGLVASIFFVSYVASRNPEQRDPGARGRARVDCAHHDHLGDCLVGDDVRPKRGRLLHDEVSARRG